jgi:hypothetical protein
MDEIEEHNREAAYIHYIVFLVRMISRPIQCGDFYSRFDTVPALPKLGDAIASVVRNPEVITILSH